ncbi:hypothetical protein [Nocardiopsis kunsanensis]|uniref:DUF3558 domain-containing protein n=1 Tax=Nocardiopsis kunsanensis TaxID=141693 RepID=A0A918XCQ2_9ACTN|nr:hypothetical protein [Nocardiopsis kunsanensis]GHD26717.1 hypothetical protein GCM10007147_25010 [Nocardiopsis kunsanensis]
MSTSYPGSVPDVQPQSRGCAVVGVVAGALTVLAAAALTGWYVLGIGSDDGGEFEAAPECAQLQNAVLDELVPSHALETEEPIGGTEAAFGSGWQCRWATPEGTAVTVPAFASAVAVVAPEPSGSETAAGTFRGSSSDRETHEISGLGDEALGWTEEGPFTIGCVATRVSNLYLEACYSGAADYEAQRSADEQEIVEASEELAEAFVEAL